MASLGSLRTRAIVEHREQPATAGSRDTPEQAEPLATAVCPAIPGLRVSRDILVRPDTVALAVTRGCLGRPASVEQAASLPTRGLAVRRGTRGLRAIAVFLGIAASVGCPDSAGRAASPHIAD